jgi:hypothetical protein
MKVSCDESVFYAHLTPSFHIYGYWKLVVLILDMKVLTKLMKDREVAKTFYYLS